MGCTLAQETNIGHVTGDVIIPSDGVSGNEIGWPPAGVSRKQGDICGKIIQEYSKKIEIKLSIENILLIICYALLSIIQHEHYSD
jgi:hypothetical protein